MELLPWHRRIRWANVARLVAALGIVALVAAWPRLAPRPPAVPAGTPRPVTGEARPGETGGRPPTVAELRAPAADVERRERRVRGAGAGAGRPGRRARASRRPAERQRPAPRSAPPPSPRPPRQAPPPPARPAAPPGEFV